MVAFNDVKAAVRARMENMWAGEPVVYGNYGFDPPKDEGGNALPYVRIRAVERGSAPPPGWNVPELSAPCTYGEIHVMACVPTNWGDEAPDVMLTAAKVIFEGVEFSSATTRITVMESTAVTEGIQDAAWYAKLISFRLRADNNPA